jgi:hypothetical protein
MDSEEVKNKQIEFEKQLKEFEDELVALHNKTYETYEKQLITISSGAIAISLTFFDNLLKSYISINLLVWAWVFLGLTIVMNMCFALYTGEMHAKTVREIKKGIINTEVWAKRNSRGIRLLNYVSMVTMVLGLVLLFSFVTINLKHMNTQSNPEIEKRGIPAVSVPVSPVITNPPSEPQPPANPDKK